MLFSNTSYIFIFVVEINKSNKNYSVMIGHKTVDGLVVVAGLSEINAKPVEQSSSCARES